MNVLTKLAERLGIGKKLNPSAESVQDLQDSMDKGREEEMRRRAEFEQEQAELGARSALVREQARILRREP